MSCQGVSGQVLGGRTTGLRSFASSRNSLAFSDSSRSCPCLGVEGRFEQTSIWLASWRRSSTRRAIASSMVAPMMLSAALGRHGQTGGLEARERSR